MAAQAHAHAHPYTDTHYHGKLGVDQATQWKAASAKTLLELLSNGSLNLAQIRAILKQGRLTPRQVRKAVWKAIRAVTTWKEQIALLKQYYPLVRP